LIFNAFRILKLFEIVTVKFC